MLKILAALLLTCLCGCSLMDSTPKEPLFALTQSGIFKNDALVRASNAIPRQLGTTFGFKFKVSPNAGGPVSAIIVTDTPGLLDPGADRPQMTYTTKATLSPGQEFQVLFTFSEKWEMAPGNWKLSVKTEKGDELAQEYEVYNTGN